MILLTVSFDKSLMVSHNLSITFSKDEKIRLAKPFSLISFQICSIGFISGALYL